MSFNAARAYGIMVVAAADVELLRVVQSEHLTKPLRDESAFVVLHFVVCVHLRFKHDSLHFVVCVHLPINVIRFK